MRRDYLGIVSTRDSVGTVTAMISNEMVVSSLRSTGQPLLKALTIQACACRGDVVHVYRHSTGNVCMVYQSFPSSDLILSDGLHVLSSSVDLYVVEVVYI